MPVEAMATGTPVIGRRFGGVSETVIDGVTGALVDSMDSARSLADAVTTALASEAGACRARARAFDSLNFSRMLRDWMGLRIVNQPTCDWEHATIPSHRRTSTLQDSGSNSSPPHATELVVGDEGGPNDR